MDTTLLTPGGEYAVRLQGLETDVFDLLRECAEPHKTSDDVIADLKKRAPSRSVEVEAHALLGGDA